MGAMEDLETCYVRECSSNASLVEAHCSDVSSERHRLIANVSDSDARREADSVACAEDSNNWDCGDVSLGDDNELAPCAF